MTAPQMYNLVGFSQKKALASASAFFNEINPCGICEIRFAWVKSPEAVKSATADKTDLISTDGEAGGFHLRQSRRFHRER